MKEKEEEFYLSPGEEVRKKLSPIFFIPGKRKKGGERKRGKGRKVPLEWTGYG